MSQDLTDDQLALVLPMSLIPSALSSAIRNYFTDLASVTKNNFSVSIVLADNLTIQEYIS